MAFFLFFPQTQRPLWYPAYEQKQNKLHLKISQDNNPVGSCRCYRSLMMIGDAWKHLSNEFLVRKSSLFTEGVQACWLYKMSDRTALLSC